MVNSSFFADGGTYDTAEVISNDGAASTTPSQAPSSFYPSGNLYNEADVSVTITYASQAAASAAAAGVSATQAAASASTAAAAVQSAAGTATPIVDGTAAVGTSTKWAHEDHVHPTDTSRAAVTYVDTQVATRATPADVASAVAPKADTSTVNSQLALKAPSANPTFTGAVSISGSSGHAIGASSPGTGWGLYYAGTINATSGWSINWQTDASLTAVANGDTLQALRVTALPVKGAFTGVTSYGVYIQGRSGVPFDYAIKVDDSSPVYFGGSFTHKPPASITPAHNGDLSIQATSNTSLTFKYKGSDGVVRSASLTLT